MRQRSRGWIMSEPDMLSVLTAIEQKIWSPKIDVRHQDVLIRIREILESDLNAYQANRSSNRSADDQEKAA